MRIPAAATALFSAVIIILFFATGGHWWAVLVAAVMTVLWLVGLNREWRWSYDASFLTIAILSAWGVGRQITPAWMVAALVLALIGWDLSRFSARLRVAARTSHMRDLQLGHLRHLTLVLMIALAATIVGSSIQFQLNLGQTILLGFVLALSLRWLVRSMQRDWTN